VNTKLQRGLEENRDLPNPTCQIPSLSSLRCPEVSLDGRIAKIRGPGLDSCNGLAEFVP